MPHENELGRPATNPDGPTSTERTPSAPNGKIQSQRSGESAGHACTYPRGNGLFIEDGEWRCYRCLTPEDRARVAALDTRARAIGIDPDVWLYGPNIDLATRARLVTWAETNRLEYAGPGHACLDWLRTGRCSGWSPNHDLANTSRAGWPDHLSRWLHFGRPSRIIAQPYPRSREWPFVSLDAEFELLTLATADDLAVIVHSDPSWYGFSTVLIEIVHCRAVAA